MKRKSKEITFNFPVPRVFDLFGEVPVSKDEIIMWVETVARLPKTSPRFDWYVKNWNVAGKIQRAKIEHITLDQYFYVTAANDARY